MKRLIHSRLRGSSIALGLTALCILPACEGQLGGGAGSNQSGEAAPSRAGNGVGEVGDEELGVGIIKYEAGLAPTQLGRLTNEEFLRSARAVLGLPAESPALEAARDTLVAEPLIGGLVNDAKTQLLKQLTVGSFATIASAATDALIEGVSSNDELGSLLGCSSGASDLSACTKEWGADLIEKAFRRPATSSEIEAVETLIDDVDALLDEKAPDPDSLEAHVLRLRTVVRYVLLAPDYLLLVEKGVTDTPDDLTSTRPLSSYEIATRMAYFLAGGPPDDELLAAAAADTLTDPAVRLAHADRLLASESGRAQVESSLLGWLGVNETIVDQASIDSLGSFIGDWFSEEKPFADFYQAPIDVAHLDGSESQEPFGVLGLHAFLGSHTSYPTPAFITRGVFVIERLLCLQLPPDLPAEALEAGAQTDLEVFEIHDQQPCASCHQYFDNFGAGLHQFDAETGLYVPGPTVLGTGFELRDQDGVLGVVDDVADLGAFLGTSERGQSCMAALWYRSAKRRDLDPSGADAGNVGQLLGDWKDSGDMSLKSLLRTIVSSEDFVTLFP